MGDQAALLGRIWDIWVKDVENEKFMREHGDKLKELQEKLGAAQEQQKENAAKVMRGMASSSEKGLLDMVLKAWIQTRRNTIKQKELQEARLANESRLEQFTKGKSEEAKYLVQQFAGASNTGLLHACCTA